MWFLENRTPFAAQYTWVQDVEGRKHWVVVVKAAYRIEPSGATVLLKEAPTIEPAPVHTGDDGVSSLKYDADLLAAKPGTDVYVVGNAHAPKGQPCTGMTVGLRVGERRKALEVVGPREYERTIAGTVEPGHPRPFTVMPLTYEHAYGGFDDEDPDPMKQDMYAPNPVGVGVATRSGRLVGKPVASIRIPGADPASAPAAGFGAVCCHWAPRSKLAGTYDGKWIEERKPLLALDYNPRFTMCAPEDQQFTPHLRGGERIDVVGMTVDGALGFDLPKVALGFETRIGRRKVPHRGRLSTVILEPEERCVKLVWQTMIPCHHEMDFLEKTVIRQKRFVT